MILHDVSLYGKQGFHHIHISKGKIAVITADRSKLSHISADDRVELNGAMALPGFINSHDHLDFNLFPQLRNRIYRNYTEWGPDIQLINKDIIQQVQKIPRSLRVSWGIYKNLLNGFTTVVNHGERLTVRGELITVFQECNSLHSPAFEKGWKWKLNNPFKTGQPMVMHTGEGTDAGAKSEIDEVIAGNIIKKRMVAVHGVAMNEEQAGYFEGLVWCPASNYFLLDETADIRKLKTKTNVVFGTDSTLTAPWNAWEHFRQAIHSDMVKEKELLDMLTSNPARLWRMNDCGELGEQKSADILVVKNTGNLFSLDPGDIQLVMHKGNIRLIDDHIANRLNSPLKDFSRVMINDYVRRVQGDLALLTHEVKKYFPAASIPFSVDNE